MNLDFHGFYLTFKGGYTLTIRILRQPQSRGGSCVFADGFPAIQPGTARLHPKGTSSRFALRAPRRFAPRNDKSEAITILTAAGTDWKCAAGSGMPLPAAHFQSVPAAVKMVIASDLSLRGAKRRGALSAKREEVPLGCNLAVPG